MDDHSKNCSIKETILSNLGSVHEALILKSNSANPTLPDTTFPSINHIYITVSGSKNFLIEKLTLMRILIKRALLVFYLLYLLATSRQISGHTFFFLKNP